MIERPTRTAFAVLALTLSGCLHSVSDDHPDAGGCDVSLAVDAGATRDAGAVAPQGGWSIRDPAPYARAGHAAIYDALDDRMIVFGGGGSDTWELPFAGPFAGQWRQLVTQGKPPPATDSVSWASAVYDPTGQRMLVLLTEEATASSPPPAVWQLSLDDAPTWSPLVTAGPNPGVELSKGRLALDVQTRTLFAVGQESLQLGVWSLPLDGARAWSRVADLPTVAPPGFIWQTELLFDSSRGQLILFVAPFDFWALSLDTRTWSLLDPTNPYSHGDTNGYGRYGVSVALDAAHDRLVMLGGDLVDGIDTFSLSDHTWRVDISTDAYHRYGTSVIVDTARGRAVYFGGRVDGPSGRETNGSWSLALDALAFGALTPETLWWDGCLRNVVYDPNRLAAIAFPNANYCGPEVNQTFRHTVAAGDTWMPLNVGFAEVGSFGAAFYADVASAIVSIGGDVPDGQMLSSNAWASWELMLATGGPPLRWGHSVVYDSNGARALVFGGSSYAAAPDGGGTVSYLDGVWGLELGGTPAWSELTTTGPSPAKRTGHAALYDERDDQMLVFGGWAEDGSRLDDLWALSLGGPSPRWSQLQPAGTAPDLSGTSPGLPYWLPQALGDEASHRLVLVVSTASGLALYALELDPPQRWHRFCSPGVAPSRLDTTVTRVGGELFASEGGGAFFFDLGTPYCD